MPTKPSLFKVNIAEKKTHDMQEVDFSEMDVQEPRDIQEWVAANPDILGDELLIIAKEFAEFDQTRERLDLLAVAPDGQLVIIELKRDDTGEDAHWQAIKYASRFRGAKKDRLVEMLASYHQMEEEEARRKLLEHTDSNEELDRLNENQRIILASHRFAPQVTSAALWLNDQAERDLISCVQLTPYKDAESGELYLLANTIIPVPGAERYFSGLRAETGDGADGRGSTNANRTDEVTRFCEQIRDKVLADLPTSLRPNRTSRWAGGHASWRYYHMWYAGEGRKKIAPWGNWDMSYQIELTPEEGERGSTNWTASVGIGHGEIDKELFLRLRKLELLDDLNSDEKYMWVWRSSESLDDNYRNILADTLKVFIETTTPVVREFTDDEDVRDKE